MSLWFWRLWSRQAGVDPIVTSRTNPECLLSHPYWRRFRGVLGLLAMLVQILLTTDHLSATAAAATLGDLSTKPLGLFEICHSGEAAPAALPADGDRLDVSPCMVCVLAGLAQSDAADAPALILPVALMMETGSLAVGAVILQHQVRRSGDIRGPPVFS